MPFPSSERVLFKKNPLEEVICQLRFPTILAIGSESPVAFQNKIRSGYPLYEREDSPLPKEVVQLLGSLSPSKSIEETVNHKFITEDSRRLISLAPDFVAISEYKYERWNFFYEEFVKAQRALEEIYQPTFYSRIGLRYRDVIDKEKIGLRDTSWPDLLQPPLIGLLGIPDLTAQIHTIKTEATIGIEEVSGGWVTIRHGIVIRRETGKRLYVIDADFYTEERRRSEDVAGILGAFNKISGNLFRWAITPKLHAALEPIPIDSGR